jgi:hypothetical protein
VQGCHHAKHALGAFYRRIQARAGSPKAIVATARKLAERVYRLLKYGAEYVCQEMEAYERLEVRIRLQLSEILKSSDDRLAQHLYRALGVSFTQCGSLVGR